MISKAIIFLLLFSQICFSQQANYQIGDTLNVFTLGGVRLREGASTSSKVLATMNLGDKVVVMDHFNWGYKYLQTIEGFKGHWIQVQFDTVMGYAFDGFLSSLPIPQPDLIKMGESTKDQHEGKGENPYRGQEMEIALNGYIKSEFSFICEPVEYYEPTNGKGGHYVIIQKIERGFTKIRHYGWEEYGTELLMPNVRFSEIKNLIILLAQRSGIDNELIEVVKSKVRDLPENNVESREVLNLNMFQIWINYYSIDSSGLKWSIRFDCSSG